VTVSVKRQIQVLVRVDESFKKKYILLLNQLIETLNFQVESYQESKTARADDLTYTQFISHKINDLFLKMDQLKQKCDEIKACPIGKNILVSTLDGQVQVNEGDDLLSLLQPVVIQSEGGIIHRIKAI
jgi:hypothetical protein